MERLHFCFQRYCIVFKQTNKQTNNLFTLQAYIFVTLMQNTRSNTDHVHTAETLPDRHTDIRGYPE